MLDALTLLLPVLLLALLLHHALRPLVDPWRRLGAVGGALLVVLPAGWWLVKTPGLQLAGELVSRVDTARRVVALTFDDGPEPDAALELAQVLRERGVRATFFLNGRDVEAHPRVVRTLADDGHELGNHSWSHPRMLFRSGAFVRKQLASTDAALRQAGYDGPIHFRAPYGKKLLTLPLVLDDQARTHVTWDVAPDSKGEPLAPEELTRRVLEQVRPGSIVLLHPMWQRASRQAVPAIVDGLRERGYRLVTVSELLGVDRRVSKLAREP